MIHLGTILQQAMQRTQSQFGGRSWWNDYLQASNGGKDALENWMFEIQRGQRQYPDWDQGAIDLASNHLANLQEHTTNVFGYNMNSHNADILGSTAAGLAEVGMLAGGAYAGGTALAGEGAAGAATAGAEGGTAAAAGGAAAGGTAAAGGASGSGGGMAATDLGGGLTVDEFGNVTGGAFEGGPGTTGSGDFFSPMGDGGLSLPNIGGLNLGGMFDGLGGAFGNFVGGMMPDKSTMMRLLPGLMALGYAGKQPGLDVGPLNSILGGLGGNQDAVIRAATDPVQANIAGGYGDLLQRLSNRGVLGSSFGNTDVANYLSTTGRSLGDTAANAAQGSLTLQGGLAGKIAELKNSAQTIKNNLYGRAFDVLGRGLNPSGYASNINLGGTPAATPGAGGASNPLANIGNWWNLGSNFFGGGGLGGSAGLFDSAGAADAIPAMMTFA